VIPPRSGGESRWPRAVIELKDDRDALTVPALERRLGDLLLTGHREIVIALPARILIDNDALVALAATARRATAHRAELSVVSADRRVRETLELCRLDGVELFSSIKRALAHPRAGVIARVRLRGRAALERIPSGLSRSSSRFPS
jgi:anti-anti-sigma regulatory factor